MTLKAVVIEDNAVFRRELMEYLNALKGVKLIDYFEDGERFLAKLPCLKIDVVFLDIGMPGL